MSANLDHDAVPPAQETIIHYGHFTLCFLQIHATHVSLAQDTMAEWGRWGLWAMELLCRGLDSPPLRR